MATSLPTKCSPSVPLLAGVNTELRWQGCICVGQVLTPVAELSVLPDTMRRRWS